MLGVQISHTRSLVAHASPGAYPVILSNAVLGAMKLLVPCIIVSTAYDAPVAAAWVASNKWENF